MANEVTKDAGVAVTIKPPKFQTAVFPIVGLSPLVIHRFSAKTKAQMKQKMEEGKPSGSRKNREAKSTDAARSPVAGFHTVPLRPDEDSTTWPSIQCEMRFMGVLPRRGIATGHA